MNNYRADLHVHTVLSPCADVEMIPPLIVQSAIENGIQLIAITDHNASANVSAVQQAAQGSDLIVLPGMELQTREEVHVLCLFDTMEQLISWQIQVNATLPNIENNIDFFGEQFIVDNTGDFLAREPRLLITSSSMTIEEAFEGVMHLGGLFIPAHINRKAFGLIENLGFVPPDLAIEALEISRHITPEAAYSKFPQIRPYPLIQNGDVHQLDSFLGNNILTMETPTIAEIRKAIKNSDGRRAQIHNSLY